VRIFVAQLAAGESQLFGCFGFLLPAPLASRKLAIVPSKYFCDMGIAVASRLQKICSVFTLVCRSVEGQMHFSASWEAHKHWHYRCPAIAFAVPRYRYGLRLIADFDIHLLGFFFNHCLVLPCDYRCQSLDQLEYNIPHKMTKAYNPENIMNLDSTKKNSISELQTLQKNKGSAASGKHFCFTSWQPIFNCGAAASHGDAAARGWSYSPSSEVSHASRCSEATMLEVATDLLPSR